MKFAVKILLIFSLVLSAIPCPDFCRDKVSDASEQNCCAEENENESQNDNACSPLCHCYNTVYSDNGSKQEILIDIIHILAPAVSDDFITLKPNSIFHPPKS